ncbi:hypothetical protein BN135_1754 [Cronobacter muytjensii 530]
MPFRGPRRRLRLFNAHVQPDGVVTRPGGKPVFAERQHAARLRTELQHGFTADARFTAHFDAPDQALVVAVAEQVFAGHFDLQRAFAHQPELEELLLMLRLKERRVRRAVREDQPVHAELAVVRRVAKIAAVGPPAAAVRLHARDGLVGPVPDKPALQARILTERIPVVGKIPQAVAHRVGVFAQNERAGFAGHGNPLFNRPLRHRRDELVGLHAGIHRADDIGGAGIRSAAFILHRAGRVLMLDPVVERGVGGPIAGLIAERPDNNARMVTVAFHHPGDALAVRAKPDRIVRQAAHRLHAVGFDIRFIHHVKPVAAAQFIPARLVRIVGAAHGVKVVLLHQQDVLHHRRLIHRLAFLRVVLVTIHAANKQRLAVERQQAIVDFHATKADVVRLRNQRHAVGVKQRDHRAVEMRRFGAPEQRVVNVERERHALRVVAALINGG